MQFCALLNLIVAAFVKSGLLGVLHAPNTLTTADQTCTPVKMKRKHVKLNFNLCKCSYYVINTPLSRIKQPHKYENKVSTEDSIKLAITVTSVGEVS